MDIFNLVNSAVIYHLLIYLFVIIPLVGIPADFVSLKEFPFDWRTIILVGLGIISLFFGSRLTSSILEKREKGAPFFLEIDWNPKRTAWVLTAIWGISLLNKLIWVEGGAYYHLYPDASFVASPFYSFFSFLKWFGLIAISLSFIQYYTLLKKSDSRHRPWGLVSWFILLVEFGYGFFSTGRTQAVAPLLVYLLARNYFFGFSYKKLLAAILVIFLVMSAVNILKTGRTYSEIITGDGGLKRTVAYVVDNSVGRISVYPVLYTIFNNTKSFLYGDDLKEFFINLGPPHFIWKNKPISINGQSNEWGRKIGILHPQDFGTSVAPTIIGDWYINFGIAGIILGMFLMGMLFRWIYFQLIERARSSSSGVLIYSILWIQIIKGMEDWIAPVYSGLVKLAVVMFLIHLALTYRKKSS